MGAGVRETDGLAVGTELLVLVQCAAGGAIGQPGVVLMMTTTQIARFNSV